MKTKLVLWGHDASDARVLIALQLRSKENKVDIYTFPESIATEEFSQKLLNEWRNEQPVEFPEGHTHIEKELSVTESLLPEDLKVERGDVVQRAQTEWHFIVLSEKMYETYHAELEELKEKVEKLSGYSSDAWSELKTFWDKVQGQVRERNLFREHANDLRENTNSLFSKMKELRKTLDNEFNKKSEEHLEHFQGSLNEIKGRLEKGLNLSAIFEDLKKLQREFKEARLTRDHRSSFWDKLDGLFKEVKVKRFGNTAANQSSSPMVRLQRRYDGLINALEKMDQSIGRDKRDLEFQGRRAENSGGQLEAQLREAKVMMINERIRSKEEKLNEMLRTKEELEKRMEIQKVKDAKRTEQDKVAAAKAEAAAKIKKDIQQAEKARAGNAEELEKAAKAMKGEKEPFTTEAPKTEAPKEEESIVGKVVNKIEDTLEDVVDTVKAVAHVVGEKIDEAVKDLQSNDEEKATEEDATNIVEETPVAAAAEPVKIIEEIPVTTAPEVTTPVQDAAAKDDLKKVEGIGPKIAELLNGAGINTFSQLAATTPDAVKAILSEAGNRYKTHDPTTWPRQAGLAAEGKWEELEKWQDELDGGKEVKASSEEE